MKLSPSQIDTLKKLISSKGYPEIDLQYEILDHVACKVEVLLEEKPEMALDDAFRKVHSEFGIFGFSDLAESYTKSIEKRYRRFFWEELRAFFTSYRIIYPAGIGFILYWLSLNTRPFGYEFSILFWGVMVFFIGAIYIFIRLFKIDKGLQNYLVFKNSTNWLVILNVSMQVNIHALRYIESPIIPIEFTWIGIGTSIGLAMIVLSFLSVFLLPRVLDRSIAETKKLQAIYES
ncbi:hypothetical protein ACPUEN_10875 [Algoriphagus yeomjeoni]|uniref:hypothetical protein n=1 Tax=Algoriphagus yeomjeoni TaxID=291403 RepID=UPI003CE51F6A